jgi:hypothetical protein
MADLKTKPTDKSVTAFVNAIPNEQKRKDARALVKLMKQVTKTEPKMWGPSIVGFGSYHYKYDSGREGDWFLTGFSPRKRALTLYVMAGFEQSGLLRKLGRYKTGKACLYIKRLSDVDGEILKEMIQQSVTRAKRADGASRKKTPRPQRRRISRWM